MGWFSIALGVVSLFVWINQFRDGNAYYAKTWPLGLAIALFIIGAIIIAET